MAGSIGSDDDNIGFQIAPMVDVVFVLMLFFMATVGSQVSLKQLDLKTPGPGGAEGTPIIIEIAADGQILMNNHGYGAPNDRTLNALREFFKSDLDIFSGRDVVIVRPTPDTRQERIVDVLNAASAAKVKSLTFG